jgi:hypothetical protein
MTRKTTDQMFDKVARDIAAQERAVAQDAADRERYAAEAEARLDEPLTRRELLDAIESVKSRYSPHHHSMLIEMLERLAEALK